MSQRDNNKKSRKFKHLTYAIRSQIEVLLKAEVPKIKIAKMAGISRATLYRELKRGSVIPQKIDVATISK